MPADTVPDLPPPDPAALAAARTLLQAARRLVIFTGAGVSAESGVPTFRGAGGLWKSFRSEELATPEAFARDPRLVWEWYAWRRDLVARCAPNAAHLAIARHGARLVAAGGEATVATQNVDGLHQRAAREQAAADGRPPAPVLALHGALFGTRCARCAWRAPADDADGTHVAGRPLDTSRAEALPRCPACGALLRPGVVWFGESLDDAVLGAAFEAAARADACLVVGTSALVQPAASVASIARRAGAALVEVNAEATPLSAHAAVALRGRAAALVPALLDS
jgi:NAD-dependent deacetylase